jgi:hypothetical protein
VADIPPEEAAFGYLRLTNANLKFSSQLGQESRSRISISFSCLQAEEAVDLLLSTAILIILMSSP